MRTLDPAQIAPNDIYKLMIGMIVPRPIAFVSSVDVAGIRNLAPFSYFTGCSTNPPVVCFCAAVRSGPRPHKDTLENIRRNRRVRRQHCLRRVCRADEPVLCRGATRSRRIRAIRSDAAGERSGEAAARGRKQGADRVPSARDSGGQREARRGILVLGEVLRFHIVESLLDGYKIDPDKLNAIGRMGGPAYIRTRDRFEMQRPK